MPNIEIHGIGMRGAFVDNAHNLRNRIFALFAEKTYVSEMVVTVFDDETIDNEERRQPFLRIVSTPSPHLEKIIELLKTLDIDIEVPPELKAFHPKKSASTN